MSYEFDDARDQMLDEHLDNISAALTMIQNLLEGTEESALPTLRDRFAMAALQGLLASKLWVSKTGLSELSFAIADCMLAARGGAK